jgi:hypothetical protein
MLFIIMVCLTVGLAGSRLGSEEEDLPKGAHAAAEGSGFATGAGQLVAAAPQICHHEKPSTLHRHCGPK